MRTSGPTIEFAAPNSSGAFFGLDSRNKSQPIPSGLALVALGLQSDFAAVFELSPLYLKVPTAWATNELVTVRVRLSALWASSAVGVHNSAAHNTIR